MSSTFFRIITTKCPETKVVEMDQGAAKKRLGRPPKFPKEGARVTQSLRVKEATRKKLFEVAQRNERSMSEEMETRIDRSFDLDDRVGGEHIRSIGESVMATLLVCQAKAGRPWNSDAGAALYAYERLTKMLAIVMEVSMPEHAADDGERAVLQAFKVVADLDEKEYAGRPGGLLGPTYRSYRSDPLFGRVMTHRLELAPIPEPETPEAPPAEASPKVNRARKLPTRAEKEAAAGLLSKNPGHRKKPMSSDSNEAA